MLLASCQSTLDVCTCPSGTPGHAVLLDDACSCLPHLEPTPLPSDAVVVELPSGEEPDWAALDAALVDGDVRVRFDRDGQWDRLRILRTDTGPHRLVLDGGSASEGRAVVAGMLTPFDEGPRHRVTVRGFEITRSRDKGIHWEAGDGILIEDVVLHDNGGTPALSLQYSNRSGHVSNGFVVRNIHLYDQRGECLYIGGSEGTDAPSHHDVVIENNLIHDCYADLDTKHDAINVKDRMSQVRVHRNVVLRADWGIEVASSGEYTSNLVFDTNREGFQVADAFSPIGDMRFADNVVVGAGHDGFHFSIVQARATGMTMQRNTVIGAKQAGVLVGSGEGIALDIEDIVVVDSSVGFDGWGEGADLTVADCLTSANDADFDRVFDDVATSCGAATVPDLTAPAGPDGLFLTDDDPWLVDGGARLP
ncbi:MAG: right-handed parallel beta-helix repeat-containing protein [Myxococcota bacterium]